MRPTDLRTRCRSELLREGRSLKERESSRWGDSAAVRCAIEKTVVREHLRRHEKRVARAKAGCKAERNSLEYSKRFAWFSSRRACRVQRTLLLKISMAQPANSHSGVHNHLAASGCVLSYQIIPDKLWSSSPPMPEAFAQSEAPLHGISD
jgi:hypothetical protein